MGLELWWFQYADEYERGPSCVKAGVAVAPPTCYRFYDSVYTERYMRTPKENEEGYGKFNGTISAFGKGAVYCETATHLLAMLSHNTKSLFG